LQVVVVGGGASGALAALHLARQAAAAGVPLDLHIVEPGELGRGVAYSTPNHGHRLNVPAAGMSARPEAPGHFADWLRRHYDEAFPAGGFAPRAVFGDYLADTLAQQLQATPDLTWTQHRTRAIDVRRDHQRRDHQGAVVTLASGQTLAADAVVLALGHGAATSGWVPEPLARSPRFVADPWVPGALPELPAGSSVLLVGTGLTMVDVAINYGHCQLHTVSRHGLLPLAHVADPPTPAPMSLPEGPLTAAQVRQLVFGRIRALDGDWRTAVDGMRPVTQPLWSRLDDAGRRQLLAQGQRRWERVRHRMAPELGAWLDGQHRQGRLTIRAASVTTAEDDGHGLVASFSDGTSVRADLVINCTGRSAAPEPGDDPLAGGLLARGSARPGPLGLGFATHPDGRLVAAGDLPAWTLGSLRRGELWESTAIPEIRDQAAALAASILTGPPADPADPATPANPARAGVRTR
jgi:uncharacterized NAD(P)/FAD-binding protein YdhS